MIIKMKRSACKPTGSHIYIRCRPVALHFGQRFDHTSRWPNIQMRLYNQYCIVWNDKRSQSWSLFFLFFFRWSWRIRESLGSLSNYSIELSKLFNSSRSHKKSEIRHCLNWKQDVLNMVVFNFKYITEGNEFRWFHSIFWLPIRIAIVTWPSF